MEDEGELLTFYPKYLEEPYVSPEFEPPEDFPE